MLKNKFGMTTRVLLIVLSVLMAVSLAACKKNDGISSDDMNSAIQSAIDAANKAQEEQNKALQSSIAAKEEAEAAQKAAEASSIAAQIKAQEEALKKAQEEADAAKKAAEAASKAAADAAAKAKAEAEKAAKDAAAKAASEAAKKAEESLKALEEALKKAQEEAEAAKKAAEEASKRAEEAMSKAEETTKAPETTVVPAETTVVPGPSVPMEDKTDVLTAFSKLKTEYTYTKQSMYNADEYAELVLLFDHASVELNNAATLDAARSIYETLKVDAAAVRNVENAAAEVAALVNALGDIETEVFTTQIEKIDEAKKAYAALKKEYKTYLATQAVAEEITVDEVATDLGINVADLNKADAKTVVLAAYIKDALYQDMSELYYNDGWAEKIHRFDAEANFEKVLVADADAVAVDTLIKDAHYKYLVLSVVNGGDLGAGLPIAYEYKINPETGRADKTQPDFDKPTEWFTTDELLEYFILPTLDVKFTYYLENNVLPAFTAGVVALESSTTYDIDLDLDDVVDAVEAEFKALSFVDDYKSAHTFKDAQNDVKTIAIKAYIEAMNKHLEAAKVVAIEDKTDEIARTNEEIQDKIDEYNDKISDTENAATIENLNAKIDNQKAKIEANNKALEAYINNVNNTTLLTFEEMLNEELAESKDYEDSWVDLNKFDADKYVEGVAKYLKDVLDTTIAKNFVVELKVDGAGNYDEDLAELIEVIVADLEALRLRVSPYEDDEANATIFKDLRGTWPSYVTDKNDTYEFPNTAAFEEVVAIIDAAIANIESATTEGVEDKKAAIVDKDKKAYYFKDVNAYNYAVEKYEYAVEDDYNAGKVIDAAEGLVGTTATAYPVEYLITAAEQVSETVIKAYIQAYTDVNAKLVTLTKMTDLAKNNKLEITNADSATDYDKIYKAHAGNAALQAELKAVADIYTGKVDTALTTFANAIAKNGDVEFKVASFYTNDNKVKNGNNITINTKAIEDGKWASKYNPSANVDKAMDKIVAEFETNFFSVKVVGIDNPDTLFTNEAKTEIDYTNSKVVELWNKKLAGVESLKTEIAKYKNTYTPIDITKPEYDSAMAGQVTVDVTKTKLPYGEYVDVNGKYGDTQILTKPEDVVAYEAALDAILADYSAKIMALTIQNDTKTTVKNGVGTKLVTEVQIKYNLEKAQSIINAYVAAVAGDENYIVTANNDLEATKTVYEYANSVIFNEFNSIVLKNTYGVTRPQVTLVPGSYTNGSVSISNAFIGSEFTVTFTPKSGYVLVDYTIDNGSETPDANFTNTDKKVTIKYNGNNDIVENIVVTATFEKKVTVENKSAEFDVDPTETVSNKKPSVTVPTNWYVGMEDFRVKATAPNTAANGIWGVNVTSATVKFYKADKTTAVGSAMTTDQYDVLTGEFVFKDMKIPADAEYATVEVALGLAPEYKVVLKEGEENIQILSQNATVLSQGADASSAEDDILWANGFGQVVSNGEYTIKIAVKKNFGYNCVTTFGTSTANQVTLTKVAEESKSDCTIYTLTFKTSAETNTLFTLTFNSVQ